MRKGPVLLLFAMMLAVALGGCAAKLPDEEPSISGYITSAEIRADGASILVEEEPSQESGDNKAMVTVNEDTKLWLDGDPLVKATVDGLVEGLRVDVWFTGPVAESYPVQATAGTVLVYRE